jgi:ParB family chromosome partitioning protein
MEESPFYGNAVFFIEVDKIKPNPFQPRRDFDEDKLNELAGSIRMYGVLQPIVVTRKEVIKEDGGLGVEYELIAGERRFRASKIAGLREIPALIRAKEDDDRVKLELAIIENLQREDISPVDKARAFKKLSEDFGLKHAEIATKVGKSREYVSNAIRLLMLPEEILIALGEGKISEGHTRPLLMLIDRPEEQNTLFREIMLRRLTVRDAENISRKIAVEKVRKHDTLADPDVVEWEQEVGTLLGTRVHVEKKEQGGRIHIDYFSEEDLRKIMNFINASKTQSEKEDTSPETEEVMQSISNSTPLEAIPNLEITTPHYGDESEDIYSVKNFNI